MPARLASPPYCFIRLEMPPLDCSEGYKVALAVYSLSSKSETLTEMIAATVMKIATSHFPRQMTDRISAKLISSSVKIWFWLLFVTLTTSPLRPQTPWIDR